MTNIPFPAPVRQIAYFVPDIELAAMAHHQQFGSGPFFVAKNIPLNIALHRGTERPLDHSSAYGQWGSMMVEFVQQNNAGPSVFHDLYPEGSDKSGLHHMAIIVDDLNESMAQFNQHGFETALYAETKTGVAFAMIDMVKPHGHMLELYAGTAELIGFYDMVADAAKNYGGIDPIRELSA